MLSSRPDSLNDQRGTSMNPAEDTAAESDSSLAALEEAGHKALELFLELHRTNAERPVFPGSGPAVLGELFDGSLGEEGIGLPAALGEFGDRVLPHATTIAHPLYLGLINCSPLPAAALADLLVSTLNNNAGALQQGPAAWAAERELVRAFSELTYGAPASGMLLPGGTYANLQALLLARARHFPEWARSGPGAAGRPRLYVGASSHFSVARSAAILGLGERDVVPIPGLGRGSMDAAALAEQVRADRREGRSPFAVVGTAGTTGTGAIDSLGELAAVCAEHGLWFHVDACYGGAALLLDEPTSRLDALVDVGRSRAIDADVMSDSDGAF